MRVGRLQLLETFEADSSIWRDLDVTTREIMGQPVDDQQKARVKW
jgi:hypothetical protein